MDAEREAREDAASRSTLSALCIRRPVLTLVMSTFLLVLGAVSFGFLGVREFPAVNPPSISVTTTYAGAIADVIETQITEPLESSINGVDGIRSLNSDDESLQYFSDACDLLGICQLDYKEWFGKKSSVDEKLVNEKIQARLDAKKNKDFAAADKLRAELEAMGIIIKDSKDGTTWEVK